jgi:hypothetical protein
MRGGPKEHLMIRILIASLMLTGSSGPFEKPPGIESYLVIAGV